MTAGLSKTSIVKAVAIAGSVILIIILGLESLASLISRLVGLSSSLDLPILVRVFGGSMLVAGLALPGWLFMYRSPVDMIVSTSITFAKLFGRMPLAERSDRTEKLVITGPQKYVRNPLYLGVMLIVFGWALMNGQTYLLVSGIAISFWFWLVQIPFEERELQVLFGDQYARYAEKVLILIPFTKRTANKLHGSSAKD